MVDRPKNTCQNFLDFFDRRDRERLDGLNEGHFAGMTSEEGGRAFNYLLRSVLKQVDDLYD